MLDQVLSRLPAASDPRVLVGTEDDAGVFLLTDHVALVQTADFFTPVVDDPYSFGAIAAANALSDIYAMGARPLTALNLVAFPKEGPLDVLAEILRGGAEKAAEAGVSIIGGHSIDDREPKYGMAVTGTVHPKRMTLKAGARPGDRLVLTKPLGIGIIATAIKENRAPEDLVARAVRQMAELNRAASEAMIEAAIAGATDITGFGLLGHLHEMLRRSGVSARLSLAAVPVLPGVLELAKVRVPGGSKGNLQFMEDKVEWSIPVSEEERLILADAQTSGGLLIAVPEGSLAALLDGLSRRGVVTQAVIGEVIQGRPGRILVCA